MATPDDAPVEKYAVSCDWHVGALARFLADHEGIEPAVLSRLS